MRHVTGPLPRILLPEAATVLHIYRQLRDFERLPPPAQQRLQARQLAHLMGHAAAHSPFWRDRLERAGIDPGQPVDLAALARLPILTRAEVQAHGPAIRARHPDWDAAQITTSSTSGSTGRPVHVDKLQPVYLPLYRALSMVDHHWHGRDAAKPAGAFRPGVEDADGGRWGPPMAWFGPVGPAFLRDVARHSIEDLYDALLRYRPAYVTGSPEVVVALAQVARERPGTAPRVEQFMTYSASLTEDVRELAREVFGARVVDRYSSDECGWIALQCPRHAHYHVMSATALVEIVDDDGRPCAEGEAGRVLVTTLHGYAMPLIRYEVGDIATRGAACDCGITLPVIARIEGRIADRVTLPGGERRVAALYLGFKLGGTEVREARARLYACGTLEVLVHCASPLSEPTRAIIAAHVRERLGPDIALVIREVPPGPPRSLYKRRELEQVAHPYAAEAARAAAPGAAG